MKTPHEMYKDIQPLIDNGWNRAAVVAMEQLLDHHPDFAQGHHDLAELYLAEGEKEKAAAAYRKAVDLEPQNHAFSKKLADYYHVVMENVDDALKAYHRLIDNGGADAETYFIAANLSLVVQRFEDAIGLYEKVLEMEPWHAEAFEYLEKVKAHVKSGNATPAQSPPEAEALGADETDADALYERSVALGVDGKDAEAIAMLEKLIAMQPENALAHNDLGVYYQRVGDPQKSCAHYRTAVGLEPINSTFQKNLADQLCYVVGEIGEALSIYLRLLKEDPEDIEVLMAAGDVCRAIDRQADAELFYSRVIEIEPWNSLAGDKLDALRGVDERKVAIQAG